MKREIQNNLRKHGYFLTGVAQDMGSSAWQTECDVNTYERSFDRANVPTHASNDNVSGVNNLFLTNLYGDLPAPAGTHPWMIDE